MNGAMHAASLNSALGGALRRSVRNHVNTSAAPACSISHALAYAHRATNNDQIIRRGGHNTRSYTTTSAAKTLKHDAIARSIHSDLQALEHLYASLANDSPFSKQFNTAAERLERCHREQRCIFVTGVGKSGIVARRLASTLTSISVRSQWVHGSEWIHGDLGGLQSGDVVIILSHSGNTSELLPLPALFAERQCDAIAIVGHEDSHLGTHCALTLAVPATDGVTCPVPSRSIIVQDAVSNAIIEYLVSALEDRTASFQANHPGGAIGDRFSKS